MNLLLLVLALQSSFALPSRSAMENPATVSQIPQKLKKDYDKYWTRFISEKDDKKLTKDLDKLLNKQKNFDPAWMIEGYLALYKGDDTTARAKFEQALKSNAANRIAVYYLAELAFVHNEYAQAASLYAQLIAMDPGRPEIETKRQRAFLLAMDSLLRSAARAESENRLPAAEDYYRQALKIAPNEPTVHLRLADLLVKENKKDEAEAARKAAEELLPRPVARASSPSERPKADDLEEIGRWGSDIGIFHQIRDAESLTREQFAILVVRYFPQVTEFRQTPQIITDIENSTARSEIQVITGIGLVPPMPNHAFEPSAPITRGDFARALARLSRLLGLSEKAGPPVAAPDVALTNALYSDVQLVLGSGIMTLQDSGSFEVSGVVTGQQAVRSVDRLVRSFQQAQR